MGHRKNYDMNMYPTKDTKPGLQTWSARDYHASRAISRGAILRAAESIALFRAHEDGKISEETSAAMSLGVFAHMAVLEPEKYLKGVAVAPAMDKRRVNGLDENGAFERGGKTILGKVASAKWAADNFDKEHIDAGTAELVKGMRSAVMGHKVARGLVTSGKNEQAATFVDPVTGLLCKYLIDSHYYPSAGGMADLKTCKDPSPEGFNLSARIHKYHVQDAHYTMGEAVRLGVDWEEVPPMTFIAVRSTLPHEPAIYTLNDDVRRAGRDICRSALSLINARVEAGDWAPSWSRSENGQPIELDLWPEFAMRNPLEGC